MVLDLHADAEEGFLALRAVPAVTADDLAGELAAKIVSEKAWPGRGAQRIFKHVKKHLAKLVNVHLRAHIADGGAAEVPHNRPQRVRVGIQLAAGVQLRKQQLGVVQQAGVRGLAVCAVVRALRGPRRGGQAQEVLHKVRHHEQLLHQRVHVAGRAQVLQAHVAARRLLRHGGQQVPLPNAPHRVQVAHDQCGNALQACWAARQLQQEAEGALPRGRCLAGGQVQGRSGAARGVAQGREQQVAKQLVGQGGHAGQDGSPRAVAAADDGLQQRQQRNEGAVLRANDGVRLRGGVGKEARSEGLHERLCGRVVLQGHARGRDAGQQLEKLLAEGGVAGRGGQE
mmetsp:Transcript_9283/g.23256  ORF Transcript_9283/g.23256 Transcript_9283/m.23256 type:complete len:341 (-) Transcript_9283:78-1100(-)